MVVFSTEFEIMRIWGWTRRASVSQSVHFLGHDSLLAGGNSVMRGLRLNPTNLDGTPELPVPSFNRCLLYNFTHNCPLSHHLVCCSDGSSGDCSRLSFLGGGSSEYSLSASRSSRSRSSHDSSSNSRVWDFSSPRESEWDVQCAAAAGTGDGGGLDNSGGLIDVQGLAAFGGHQSLLSPGIPRPGGKCTSCDNGGLIMSFRKI